MAVNKLHDQGNSYAEKHVIEAGLQFQKLVHYHHGGKQGSMQVDMMPEKDLGVLHLDLKAARRSLSLHSGWHLSTRSLHSSPRQ